jgi:integration host factor subunit alpha
MSSSENKPTTSPERSALSMILNRESLTDSVCRKVALSKRRSTLLVKSLLEIMKGSLESREDVLISGFGKFWVKDKKDQKGRNPRTKEGMMLRARRVVRFRRSQILAVRIGSVIFIV